MFRTSMKSALLASVVAVTAVAPLAGARHNRLVRAEPGVDSNVKQSPAEIRLWFKEPPELAVSSIKLADAAGKAYATGSVKATDDKTSIAAGVTTALPPGRYTVTWKTAGVDGHVIRGSFEFTVAT
jgi:methionine-rich copper-binding protein CopC